MLTITTAGEKTRLVVVGSPAINFSLFPYFKLSKHPEFLVDPLEQVFGALSDELWDEVYDLYHDSSVLIDALGETHTDIVVNVIRNWVSVLVHQERLDDVLVDLVKKGGFPIPSFSDAGTKEHHDERRTFYEDDYVDLTAICLLTKLLVPVWGSLHLHIPEVPIGEGPSREELLYDTLFATVSNGRFSRVFNKLEFFTKSTVERARQRFDKRRSETEQTSAEILKVLNISDEEFENRILAILMVKKIPSFELFSDRVNMMIYIDSSLQQTTENSLKAMRCETR